MKRAVALAFAFALVSVTATGASTTFPVDGHVVQTAPWSNNGGEQWTVVVSRYPIVPGVARFQYELSFLRPRRYMPKDEPNRSGFERLYVSPGAGAEEDFLTKFQPDVPALKMASPNLQSVKIVGVFDGYIVVQKHEQTGDCGSSVVGFFAFLEGHAEIQHRISNACGLSARIVRRNGQPELQLDGPYYKPSRDPASVTPLCCPTLTHARAYLRKSGAGYVIEPSYFALQ